MKGTELMDRIRDEMAAAKNDHISLLGEMMTEYLRIHPETEIDEKCSLKGAYQAMYEHARKQNRKEYAYWPREAFDFVLNYFGLPHADADYKAVMLAMIGQPAPDIPTPKAPPKQTAPTGDLFDLDALLGV